MIYENDNALCLAMIHTYIKLEKFRKFLQWFKRNFAPLQKKSNLSNNIVFK